MFCARGIKEVSITEISKAAEVSQVSIYNFFGSKENLAKEAIFSIMNEKMADAEVLVDSNIPFRDKIEKLFLDEKETIYGYNEEFLNSLIWKEPAVEAFIQEYYQTRTVPLLIKLIAQGKEEGFINPSINSEAVIIYINSINSSLH